MINTLGLNSLLIDWRVCLLFRLFQTDPLFLKFSADPVYHNLDHFRLGPSLFRDTPQRRFHKKLRNSLLQPFKLHSSRHLGRYLWHFAFVYCRHLHSLSVCLSGRRLSQLVGIYMTKITWMNEDDVYAWAGHIRWFRGSLATVQAGTSFNYEHELMYFHNPSIYLDYHEDMRSLIFDDMILYGYLLPAYIPLLSRFQCR
jgi:hypothetical protein